jgi:hypothetical protein
LEPRLDIFWLSQTTRLKLDRDVHLAHAIAARPSVLWYSTRSESARAAAVRGSIASPARSRLSSAVPLSHSACTSVGSSLSARSANSSERVGSPEVAEVSLSRRATDAAPPSSISARENSAIAWSRCPDSSSRRPWA